MPNLSSRSSPLHRVEARQVFQWLSYLQYPLLAVALVYMCRVMQAAWSIKATGLVPVFEEANHVLLYAGVAIGLSSLQDPRKTQNRLSLRIWQDPTKGRLMLWVLALEAFVPITIGLVGATLASDTVVSELALGLVAFGLGMIGLLKTAIEMREHHRSDRRVD